MRPRHPLPRLWLMTDERIGDGLWEAIRRLPRGSGVVFRHYRTPAGERRRIFAQVRRIARARGLVLLVAGASAGSGAQGRHGAGRRRAGLRTWPVHTRAEALAARRADADAVFISPIFVTRSHPGVPALGRRRATRLARLTLRPAVALGGVTPARFRRLDHRVFWGWAAIDAWAAPDQR